MRKLIILLAAAAAMLQARALAEPVILLPDYRGVAKMFVEETGDIFNTLSRSARHELLSAYGKDGKDSASVVSNDFGSTESRLMRVTDDYMLVATSSSRMVEMKLLPKSKRDTVVVVIETARMPHYSDSRITFYDTKWNKLDTDEFIDVPCIDDFIVPKAPEQLRRELLSEVAFAMIEMKLDGDELVAQCNLKNFFLGENYDRYSSIVLDRVTYSIKKAKFKKIESR